jgi:hypothetical protein
MRPRAEQPIPLLILRELAFGPSTNHELAETTGINLRNIRPYLKMMQGEYIHIGGWEQRTGPALPVWHLGAGPDKPRPRRKYRRY